MTGLLAGLTLTGLAAKALVAMLEKCMTQIFFSKVLVFSLKAWAKQTENDWDDKVVDAVAEALEVPAEKLK